MYNYSAHSYPMLPVSTQPRTDSFITDNIAYGVNTGRMIGVPPVPPSPRLARVQTTDNAAVLVNPSHDQMASDEFCDNVESIYEQFPSDNDSN